PRAGPRWHRTRRTRERGGRVARWFGGRRKKNEAAKTPQGPEDAKSGRAEEGLGASSVPADIDAGADELMDRAYAHCGQGELVRAEILFEAAIAEYRRTTESLGTHQASGEVVLKIAMALRMHGKVRTELGRFDDAVDAGAEALALLQ